MFENITASEVAGYGVGALLLYATLSATKIDSLISTSQRRYTKILPSFVFYYQLLVFYAYNYRLVLKRELF